jgi:4-hydroxy-2-oxoheptanedioate aldolase
MRMRLKQRLDESKIIRVFCLGQLASPKFIEILSWCGDLDAVWLDQEHGALGTERLEDVVRAARGCGMGTFVRLAPTDYRALMRPLEAGAGGIMAAQVQSADHAEQIVRWAKFHPRGIRGINNTGVDGRYGMTTLSDYLREQNEDTLIAIQIENQQAVEDVEAIASVPDVDFLFVGPADLSQSLGIPGEWDHPKLWQAIERVAEVAREHKVAWAYLPPTPGLARRAVELGCRILSLGIDVWIVQRGMKAFQQEYAEFFSSRGEELRT